MLLNENRILMTIQYI